MGGAGIQAPLLHQSAAPVTTWPPSIAQAAASHPPSSQSGQVNEVSKAVVNQCTHSCLTPQAAGSLLTYAPLLRLIND